MTQLAFDLTHARAQRDDGMARAKAHAEEDSPGWTETALTFLKAYAKQHSTFAGFMVTGAAELDVTFPRPANERSWGAVYRLAVRRGIIRNTGRTIPHPKRHASPAVVWEAL